MSSYETSSLSWRNALKTEHEIWTVWFWCYKTQNENKIDNLGTAADTNHQHTTNFTPMPGLTPNRFTHVYWLEALLNIYDHTSWLMWVHCVVRVSLEANAGRHDMVKKSLRLRYIGLRALDFVSRNLLDSFQQADTIITWCMRWEPFLHAWQVGAEEVWILSTSPPYFSNKKKCVKCSISACAKMESLEISWVRWLDSNAHALKQGKTSSVGWVVKTFLQTLNDGR